MARIVLADDDPGVRRSLARYLSQMGHEVAEAEDGRAALAAMNEAVADLVLTDINMPDMDGIELLRALRKSHESVPVIAMSGGGYIPGEVLLGSAAQLGAVATLAKPFALDELERVVSRALEA